MSREYQKAFFQYLSEVKLLANAESAKYELSDEVENVVVVSGKVIGNDTSEKLIQIGKKYGLVVLANNLTVIHRGFERFG